MAEALFREAFKGNVAAIKEIFDRTEGRVPLPTIERHHEPANCEINRNVPRPDREPVAAPTVAKAS